MRITSSLKVAVLGLVLAGCRDGGPISPLRDFLGEPSTDISHGGSSHFYFLAPVVNGEPTVTGAFNPELSPTVRICAVPNATATSPGSVACTSTLTTFSGAGVQVSTTDEHYKVNWDTDAHGGVPGTYYRILVNVGDLELGYADVYVATSAKDLKSSQTSTTLGLVDGRTLPVKFRIEQGAVGAAKAKLTGDSFVCNDCVEETVTPGTAEDIVTPAGFAAVHFPANALDGRPQVTVTINRVNTVTNGPCFPPGSGNALIQAEGCYEYDTEPFLTDGFANPVRIELCLDQSKNVDDYELYKYSARRTPQFTKLAPGGVTALVNCSGFTLSSGPVAAGWNSARLLNLAQAGWSAVADPLAWAFGPTVLMATDYTYSGAAENFSPSRIGWGQALSATAVAGGGQTAAAGSTLPTQPKILVQQGRTGHPQTPASGVPVTWTFKSPTGAVVGTVTTVTAADGTTSTAWVLTTTTGTHTVDAMVPGGASVPFSATAASALPSPRIDAITLDPNDIPIGGSRSYSATLVNDGAALSGVYVQTYIVQGSINQAAGGAQTSCPNSAGGALPTGSCPFAFTLNPTNLATGSGGLVPGAATARFELRDATGLLHSVTRDITLADDPIAYWDGSSFNSVKGGNDGTAVNASIVPAGFAGPSYAFGGGSAYIDAGGGNGVNSAENVTLATWVAFGTNELGNGFRRFISLKDERAVLRMDGTGFGPGINSLHFYVKNSSGAFKGLYANGVLVDRGCYYHVAGTYDGSTLRVYLDGEQVGSTPHTGALAVGNGMRLSNDGGEALNGWMDEIRVYNRALSASEIAGLASASGSGKCRDIIR